MYHLNDLKEFLGPVNSGERVINDKTKQVTQFFGWECGCNGHRSLGDIPLKMNFCYRHRNDLTLKPVR